MQLAPLQITPHDAEDAAAGHWHDDRDFIALAWLARYEGLGHRLVTWAVLAGVAFVVIGLATGWL